MTCQRRHHRRRCDVVSGPVIVNTAEVRFGVYRKVGENVFQGKVVGTWLAVCMKPLAAG